jgi:hypothetical protein
MRITNLIRLTYKMPNASSLPEGQYAWRIVAIDGAGNETASPINRLTIDLP